MDKTNLTEQMLEQTMETIVKTKEQIAEQQVEEGGVKDDEPITKNFEGLPIESLICGPIIAAARGQQALNEIYIDTVKKLAYVDGTPESGTNILNVSMDRPVTQNDGTIGVENCTIKAPLLALVPVPAFTMDELTIDFDMTVKTTELSQDETKASATTKLDYKSWFGMSANITGTVSSDSLHKRETDNSATYNIHARAIQQPPSEGMAKLTSLFAQMMEPINTKDIK